MEVSALKKIVIGALEDLKARDLAELDVRGGTGVTDYLIIVSGTSNRHVRALADNLVQKVKERGVRPLGVEGEENADWVLIDLGDVVVHVMMEETREYYDLERLWGFSGKDGQERTGLAVAAEP